MFVRQTDNSAKHFLLAMNLLFVYARRSIFIISSKNFYVNYIAIS